MSVASRAFKSDSIRRRRFAKAGIVIASFGVAGLAAVIGSCKAEPLEASQPPLDISRYRLTFNEDFNTLDVSPRGPKTRWIAHTPWNGDFGDARFLDPRPGRPFTIKDGILSITMGKDDGHWASGLLAANNDKDTGFSQSGGYFEARAKFPHGSGVWPAFWLGSTGKPGQPAPEIDIVEYYGHDQASYMVTIHLWKDGKDLVGKTKQVFVTPGSLETGFHTFGVSIDPKAVNFYLDRHLMASMPSSPDFMRPCYPIVNLAAGGGWPIDQLPPASTMQIDYVRAYQLKN